MECFSPVSIIVCWARLLPALRTQRGGWWYLQKERRTIKWATYRHQMLQLLAVTSRRSLANQFAENAGCGLSRFISRSVRHSITAWWWNRFANGFSNAFSHSLEILFRLHPYLNNVNDTQFSTCHDSCAVVACAKLCCDMIPTMEITAKGFSTDFG